jgi:hypothetical protein
MNIYICLETIIKCPNIIEKIKDYYNSGNNITIACTKQFKNKTKLEEIKKILLPLKYHYHTLSFLKSEYDLIIDSKSVIISF